MSFCDKKQIIQLIYNQEMPRQLVEEQEYEYFIDLKFKAIDKKIDKIGQTKDARLQKIGEIKRTERDMIDFKAIQN